MNLDLRRVRLSAMPERADARDYEAASAELDAALAALPGCVAVYRTGAVSVPGISDIDRVLVTQEGTVADVWSHISPQTRRLAMHTPFAADVETFERHRLLAHLEPLELVHGDAVDVRERPEPELVERILGAEGATVLLLQIAKTAVTGTAKVRPLLCALHGLRHDLALARLGRDDAARAWRFADDVAQLRADWFDHPDPARRFRALLAEAPAAVGSAFEAMGNGAEALVGRAPSRLPLRAPWNRARARPGEAAAVRAFAMPPIGSRRAGELAWRAIGADVVLPRAVAALLAGHVAEPYRAVAAERRDLAARHRARRQRGYGTLGLAPIFLP